MESAPEPFNPFAPPQAPTLALEQAGPASTEAEPTRRRYLRHEAAVRALGGLTLLAAVLIGLIVVNLLGQALGLIRLRGPGGGRLAVDARLARGAQAAFALLLVLGATALGIGLRRLQPAAQWTAILVAALGLLACLRLVIVTLTVNARVGRLLLDGLVGPSLVAGLLAASALFLLVSTKGAVVFSMAYHAVVAETPQIRPRTSPIVRVVLVLLLAFGGLLVVMAVSELVAGLLGGRRS